MRGFRRLAWCARVVAERALQIVARGADDGTRTGGELEPGEACIYDGPARFVVRNDGGVEIRAVVGGSLFRFGVIRRDGRTVGVELVAAPTPVAEPDLSVN